MDDKRLTTSPPDFVDYMVARWPKLVRSGILLGCNEAEAEDLAQIALVKCLSHWRKVQNAQNIDAYVYRVLLNCLASGKRRHWRNEIPNAEVPDRPTADFASQVESDVSIRTALANLSLDHRSVVILKYYAGFSEREMVDVLKVPAGTIKSRLSRALAILGSDPALQEIELEIAE